VTVRESFERRLFGELTRERLTTEAPYTSHYQSEQSQSHQPWMVLGWWNHPGVGSHGKNISSRRNVGTHCDTTPTQESHTRRLGESHPACGPDSQCNQYRRSATARHLCSCLACVDYLAPLPRPPATSFLPSPSLGHWLSRQACAQLLSPSLCWMSCRKSASICEIRGRCRR